MIEPKIISLFSGVGGIDLGFEEAGFKITDEQLTEIVHQFPEFHVDGRFDQATYMLYLEGAAMTPARFEASQKVN